MIWRKVQQLQEKKTKLASEWLETLNHSVIISHIGDSNAAKIERRLMSFYETLGLWEEIPKKKDLMSLSHQRNVLTLPYLLGYFIHLGNTESGKLNVFKGFRLFKLFCFY